MLSEGSWGLGWDNGVDVRETEEKTRTPELQRSWAFYRENKLWKGMFLFLWSACVDPPAQVEGTEACVHA